MQLVRFQYAGSRVSWGVRVEGELYDIGSLAEFAGEQLGAIELTTPRHAGELGLVWAFANWASAQSMIEIALQDAKPLDVPYRLLCPVPAGGRVICIGLNYRDHAIESSMEIPSEPVVFNKWNGALCGPDDPIVLPKNSQAVDFEAELVMIVGKPAWQVEESFATEHIFGYSCGHDVSARDWQIGRPGGQWLLGKSFPTFAPVGPWIVPQEMATNIHERAISLRIDGETLQSSTTKQLIFSPPRLISFLSQFCKLEPGDVIFTGTPPGVGMARKPPRYLKPGEMCEVEIEGLGVLRNRCVAA